MSDQGIDLRSEADRLVAAADAVAWNGAAAEAMRSAMRDVAVRVHKAADEHDNAASALARHADEVDELKALIASIESRVHGLVADARSKVAGFASAVADGFSALAPDGLTERLASFAPPPPGDMAWLDVDLPGLRR